METFIFVTVMWVFSVCLHEYGHAIVAYKGGDYTVKDKGYLDMNPLNYAEPVTSFILPVVFMMLGGFGLPGGAVYIERSLIRSRGWLMGMSLAGPAMNLVLTLVLCVPFWIGLVPQSTTSTAACALAFLIQLQLSAIVFNLIPVPPLDGFRAMSAWMSDQAQEKVMEHAQIFFFLLIFLMWNVPLVYGTFWTIVHIGMWVLGIDSDLAYEGLRDYRFWTKGD